MTDLPADDQLELSLFGAGVGESVVVHIGSGSWVIVDSCINATTSRPIALDYFDEIGVDVANHVKLIVVTHWHDDHIGGVAELLRVAKNAEFACSAAINSREFFSLVAASDSVKLVQQNSGLTEFTDVLQILQERAVGGLAIGPHCWASEGTRVLLDSISNSEVFAVSPSAQTITDATGHLADLMPKVGPIRRFASFGPNDLSVALLIKTAGLNLLLGGDLETGRDDLRGWRAAVASNRWPRVQSSAFKIPHHGSITAHLDSVWTQCLYSDPWALMTPYARGRTPLPTSSDVTRLKSSTTRVYCTINPAGRRPARRRGIESTLREVAKSRRVIPRQPGHIRLRLPVEGHLGLGEIELLDGAISL